MKGFVGKGDEEHVSTVPVPPTRDSDFEILPIQDPSTGSSPAPSGLPDETTPVIQIT